MGGPASNTENQQSALATQQGQITEQEFQASQANLAKQNTLEQPDINFLQSVTSGNKNSLIEALGPQLTNLSTAKAATAAQIDDSVGPGAARDIAQATNIQSANTNVANLENTTATGALDKLANIGAGFGATGLSEVGAALSGASGESSTLSSVANEQNQGKDATLGFLGSLTGQLGSGLAGSFGH
jgi:hypothetical protein